MLCLVVEKVSLKGMLEKKSINSAGINKLFLFWVLSSFTNFNKGYLGENLKHISFKGENENEFEFEFVEHLKYSTYVKFNVVQKETLIYEFLQGEILSFALLFKLKTLWANLFKGNKINHNNLKRRSGFAFLFYFFCFVFYTKTSEIISNFVIRNFQFEINKTQGNSIKLRHKIRIITKTLYVNTGIDKFFTKEMHIK
jgi:hypothetical protein